MFCSTCGASVANGLSYCNHCGAKLIRDDESKSAEVKPEVLIRAILSTFVLGLMTITILIGVMKAVLDLPIPHILAFMIFLFGLMVVLEGIFIRMLFRSTRNSDARRTETPLKRQATNELEMGRVRSLGEGVASVTEHTTRAFDPIHIERK